MDAVVAPSAAAGVPWSQVAEDLGTLSWLHASEHPSAVWMALEQTGFPQGLVLLPPDDPARIGMGEALQALRPRAEADPQATDDELAADYAAIYLTHALRASPCESVWRDEDHLMWQGSTFEVREDYRRHGLAVRDWREMPDDHLCNELAFVAALLSRGDLVAAKDFMGRHLLVWLPSFAQRVNQRANTRLYAGLAVLTAQACLSLKDVLDRLTSADTPVGS